MTAYSFQDVACTIVGPGGAISLGQGAGTSEEGITVEMVEDKDTMTIGSDGSPMHSLHAGKASTMTVRLLKTSPVNALLSVMYDLQTASSALHGLNVIGITDLARGDAIVGTSAAFRRWPSITYAKEGNMNEWVFNVGSTVGVLGGGTTPNT